MLFILIHAETEMANGFFKINDADFLQLPIERQNLILFRNMEHFNAKYESDRNDRFNTCSGRMDKIEKRQKIEFGFRTGIAAVTGAIGGFISGLTK